MGELVYRYLHSHGLKFLSNLKLKVSIPTELDDPFELRPRVGDTQITSQHVHEFLASDARMDELYKSIRPKLPLQKWKENGRKNNGQFEQEFRAAVTAETFEKYCQQSLAAISNDYGLICFSKTFDDILMWSHYGDKHRGIVIGFCRNHLETNLAARALDVTCRKERVPYNIEQFIRPEGDYVRELLTTKSESWQYQQEVRYVIPLRGLKANCRRQIFIELPAASIRRVLIGCSCPAPTIKAVHRLLKRKGISVPVEVGAPHSSEFKLLFSSAAT